ncbi:MAG: undecaprenyl-diphosphate phosphatase [Bacteroidetes bacterium]|nr:undecaprenyl-diphosphate phosphatase [Bacteroidota bacterium]
MTVLQAIIMAIVEGLTEFLPISSTGHMALTGAVLGIEKEGFTKLFIETVQFGAIISVIVLYWRKFLNFKKLDFYLKLFIAFIPAAIVGVLLKKRIEAVLESPIFITAIMFLGGILLLFVDNWFKNSTVSEEEKITYKNSLVIGLFQLLAVVFPGFSRSAATIIGGMQQKLNRTMAAEFSFFLAVPTLAGAFAKSLWDAYRQNPELLNQHNINMIILGNIVAFIVAIIAIKGFITFLIKHGFRLFGWYRIIVGILLLVFLLTGHSLSL